MPTGQRPVWQWWQAPGSVPSRSVVLDVDRPVAVERDHRRRPDRDGVGAQRERLGRVDAVPDAAGDDQVDHARRSFISRSAATASTSRRHGRDAGVVHQRVGRGAGAALHAVDHDHVGAGLARQLDVVGHAAGADLDVDRDLPVGRLAQLLDLDLQVVGPDEVGVAARGERWSTPGRQLRASAMIGDTFAPSSTPPVPGFAPWPIDDLGGVGHPQVVGVEAVAAGQHLVDQLVGRLPLEVEHAAVAGGGRDADAGRRHAQRLLGVARQRAVAHAGDGDRRRAAGRLGAVAAADLDRVSQRLAVALERHAGQGAGHERQVVEVRAARLVMPRPRLR